jgi:hypothetical protein
MTLDSCQSGIDEGFFEEYPLLCRLSSFPISSVCAVILLGRGATVFLALMRVNR